MNILNTNSTLEVTPHKLSVDEKPVVTGLMVIPSPSVDTKNSK